MTPTTSQVNRAGHVLRKWKQYAETGETAPLTRALDVLVAFRAAHAQPLIKANNGLRSMLRTEACPVEVSQRLKRASTIIDKLTREPTMALSRMQDIGGCRAIVASVDELRRMERRLVKNRPPVQVTDYAAQPKASGYRSVHVVVTYDNRCVEIQLRTRSMHEWAVAVERLGGRLGQDLKSGVGPPEVLAWLHAVSEALELEDQGETVDSGLMERISRLRQRALPYLAEGRPS